MIKKVMISFSSILLLITSLVIVFVKFSIDSSKLNIDSFKNGDIIFVNGTSWRATILRLFGKFDSTHVGIIIEKNNQKYVFEAIPIYEGKKNKSGVVLTSIKSFFNDVSAFTILRNSKKINIGNKHIEKYLHLDFDDKFDRNSKDKIFCTELIDLLLIDFNYKGVSKGYTLWPSTLFRHLKLIGFKQII